MADKSEHKPRAVEQTNADELVEEEEPPEQKNQQVRDRIIQALEAKILGGGGEPQACTICGNRTWGIGSFAPMTSALMPTQVRLGGQVYPFITIFCSNCGNTQLVNLLILGFSDEDLKTLVFADEDN